MTANSTEDLLARVETFHRGEMRRKYVGATFLILAWTAVLAAEVLLVAHLDMNRRRLLREHGELLKKSDTLTTNMMQLERTIALKQAELNKLNDDLQGVTPLVTRQNGRDVSTSDLIARYDWALKTDKDNAVLYNLKGYALYRRGDLPDAIANLNKATSLNYGYVWGHYNLALALWAYGDQDAAVREVRHVLSLDSSFASVIANDAQFRRFNSSPSFIATLTAVERIPRVYLLVPSSALGGDIAAAQKIIADSHFTLVTIAKVESGDFKESGEVIYYHQADSREAEALAGALRSGTQTKVRTRLSANPKERSRRYDVKLVLGKPVHG